MLTISRRQMEILEEQQRATFVVDLVKLLEQRYPGISDIGSRKALTGGVACCVDQAHSRGLTYRDEVASYCLLCYHLGHHFESDPQFPWIGACPMRPSMQRLHLLLRGAENYTRLVLGAGNRHLLRAIEFWQFSSGSEWIQEDTALPQSLTYLWPQKAEYLGDSALVELCRSGAADAQVLGIVTRPQLILYIESVFLLGVGWESDPLFVGVRDAVFGSGTRCSSGWPSLLHKYAAAICRARTASYQGGQSDG